MWSVLGPEKFNIIKDKSNNNELDKLVKTYLQHLSIKSIIFQMNQAPMTIRQIPKFKNLNPSNSLTVIGYDLGDKEVFDTHRRN